jgi:hypothetical protein
LLLEFIVNAAGMLRIYRLNICFELALIEENWRFMKSQTANLSPLAKL